MTGSEVGVRDRLFHTLDPTTRTLRLAGRTYLMTDTVGFIRKLPHQLVDAFAATLEETKRADLLLHVVDASAPEEELVAMTRAVEDVLEEIGVGDQPRILVLNKADQLDDERRHELAFRHADASLVSAVTGEGLEALQERIAEEFERQLRDVELLVPFSEGGTIAELHDLAGDLERTDTAEGALDLRPPPGVSSPSASTATRSMATGQQGDLLLDARVLVAAGGRLRLLDPEASVIGLAKPEREPGPHQAQQRPVAHQHVGEVDELVRRGLHRRPVLGLELRVADVDQGPGQRGPAAEIAQSVGRGGEHGERFGRAALLDQHAALGRQQPQPRVAQAEPVRDHEALGHTLVRLVVPLLDGVEARELGADASPSGLVPHDLVKRCACSSQSSASAYCIRIS